MATSEVGPVHPTPLDRLGKVLHETAVGFGHAVQKHPLRIALTSGLTVLGLGAALNLQKYFVPPNRVDNAPISDTLKPPVDGQNVGIIISPPVDSTPASSPSSPPVEQSATSPVEEAIKAGRIEIKDPTDVEKYFTFVSPAEARQMLAEAKAKGEFKFLFPSFEITGIKDLVIGNFTLSNGQVSLTYLAVQGIPSTTTFRSNSDAAVSISTAGAAPPSTPKIRVQSDTPEYTAYLDVPKTISGTEVPVGATDWPLAGKYDAKRSVRVEIDDPLFVYEGSSFLNAEITPDAGGGTFRDRFGDWNMTFLINRGNDWTGADLNNALLKGRKIALVGPSPR